MTSSLFDRVMEIASNVVVFVSVCLLGGFFFIIAENVLVCVVAVAGEIRCLHVLFY